jgi:hypothetical protein
MNQTTKTLTASEAQGLLNEILLRLGTHETEAAWYSLDRALEYGNFESFSVVPDPVPVIEVHCTYNTGQLQWFSAPCKAPNTKYGPFMRMELAISATINFHPEYANALVRIVQVRG